MADTIPDPIPFVGDITAYLDTEAPSPIRKALEQAGKDDILAKSYPYREELGRKDYDKQMKALQVELVKMLYDLRQTGKKLVVIFEGRDAAGKGGAIERMRENLNPRSSYIVALP
ncbi:MAG: polyphosphate kinase 2, partial [Albidovulum sp.]